MSVVKAVDLKKVKLAIESATGETVADILDCCADESGVLSVRAQLAGKVGMRPVSISFTRGEHVVLEKLDRDIAREHFCILNDALYAFHGAGGNLHILTDDINTNDDTIKWLDERMPKQKESTHAAQWAVERAILDLFMLYEEDDRDFILLGIDMGSAVKGATKSTDDENAEAIGDICSDAGLVPAVDAAYDQFQQAVIERVAKECQVTVGMLLGRDNE